MEQHVVNADTVLDMCHFQFLELEIQSITNLMNVSKPQSNSNLYWKEPFYRNSRISSSSLVPLP